jgi:hypothetical protein
MRNVIFKLKEATMIKRILYIVILLTFSMVLSGPALASVIYVTGNEFESPVGAGTFGRIDTATGQYTQISTYAGVTAPYNLVNNGNGFYTTVNSETNYSFFRTISMTGVVAGSQTEPNVFVTGMASRSGALYAYDYNTDRLGTLDPLTGAITAIGLSGLITGSSFGGRLAFLDGTLYGTLNDGSGSSHFGSFNLNDGSFSTVASEDIYKDMVLASKGSTLYGLYNNRITIPGATPILYTIDTAGGTTKVVVISGDNLPLAFNGADFASAVPEPSTYALFCLSLGVVGYARKRMNRRA